MNTTHRKIAGFMSAESIYSLAFYIVMVAAIAGVGAGIMSKTASAKGVSAVSILRANYQAEASLLGYGAVAPTAQEIVKLSHGLISLTGTAAPFTATLTGVGSFTITNRPTATPVGFSINVAAITSVDVCKAIGSVGWGSWDGVVKGALASTSPVPNTSAGSGPASLGLIPTKTLLLTVCNAVKATAPVQITLVSQ